MSEVVLAQAIAFAANAHAGQIRKFSGKPYIFHPLRVMMNMHTHEERVLAVLHDVLEDTDADEPMIRLHFGERILEHLKILTRVPGEKYADYIERVAMNPLATKIKKADLADNINEHTPAGLAKRNRDALGFLVARRGS